MPEHSLLVVLPTSRARTQPEAGAAALRQLVAGWSLLVLVGLATCAGLLRQHQPATGRHALQPLLDAASALDDAGKLSTVNTYFNQRIHFRADAEVWGQADHWASPLELLGKGEGDCEDFAIAKYFSLRALGVPAAQLRLVYALASPAGLSAQAQPHMVLAYFATPHADPLLLDNLRSEVLGAAQRTDLTPVFSFNRDGLWRGIGPHAAGDPTVRLPRWRETIAKAGAEGFL